MICELCKKLVSPSNSRKIEHYNIIYSSQPIIFCSKKCYNRWRNEIHTRFERQYVLWNIKSNKNKYIFIKERKKVKRIDLTYGIPTENSHFSKELSTKPDEMMLNDNE
ncbi:MAG: hypothetical protein GF317_24580 [Candidatus Lokiarchaeota archaeon]|nr:hypothetical protein [Candidatus Lokiarchaeota archaeon]MBD3202540.1 hypothetical protein [Candidatus Lokiarchaeota archaeon]